MVNQILSGINGTLSVALQEGTKVCCMDWSKFDPSLIVSADETGSIVCWDLFSNVTRQLNFGKLVPTCLACCPHRRDLIAMGTRSGLVCTVSLKGYKHILWYIFTLALYGCETFSYFEGRMYITN
jgi:hypothetical protein